MPLEEIASHLDERFSLLDGVRHGGQQHHQNLSALMDWTWNLLSGSERHLAARLALLPGGATGAAAAALVDGDATEGLRLVSSLVDKSLLHQEVPSTQGRQSGTAERDCATRYHLLETPRLYLTERLQATGDAAAAAEAADHYLTGLAAQASHMLLGGDQDKGLAVLDAESTNLTASLHRMLGRDDISGAAQLGTALAYYWFIRGRYAGLGRWAKALGEAPAGTAPVAQAVASAIRPVVPCQDPATCTTVDGPAAQPPEREEPRQEPGQRRRSGSAPDRLTMTSAAASGSPEQLDEAVLSAFPPLVAITTKLHVAHGDHDRARADTAVARGHPDPRVRAAGAAAQARIDEAHGDVVAAEAATAEALELFRQVGDQWACAQTGALLADFQSLRGDVAGAVSRLRGVVDLERSQGLRESLPATLARLGTELLRAHEHAQAMTVLHEALDAAPALEVRVLCLAGLARTAIDRGEADRGRTLLAQARQLLSTPFADADYLAATVLREEARLALHEDDAAQARDLAEQAWHAARRVADAGTQAEAAELVAATLLRSGEPETASSMRETAAAFRGR